MTSGNSSGSNNVATLAIASAFVLSFFIIGASSVFEHYVNQTLVAFAAAFVFSGVVLKYNYRTAYTTGLSAAIAAIVSHTIQHATPGIGGWFLSTIVGATIMVVLVAVHAVLDKNSK